ncbi:MAG: DsrE family protein [Burkholderiales bacterium]|nr:DsrE family protein [Burkholderiales bacterium]
MKILIVLNDAPYGNERSYNGTRLAGALARRPETEVRIFLIGDAVAAVHRSQTVPEGYYNLEQMLTKVIGHNGILGVCGTCLDARGIGAGEMMDGPRRSTLDELAAWTVWADQVLVF